MTRWSWFFLLLLTLSIGLNLKLWLALNPQTIALELNEPLPSPRLSPQPEPSIDAEPKALSRQAQLQRAQRLLANKEFIELGTLLQSYLRRHPLDMEFLLLEASMKVETSLLSDAIINYYDLLRRPLNSAQYQEVVSKIDSLAANAIEQLASNHSWDALAQFVEPLVQVAPDNRRYVLALAKAYAAQDHYQLMENTLAALPQSDAQAQALRRSTLVKSEQTAATAPLPSITPSSLPSDKPYSAIALQQVGDQYVVAAKLVNQPINLLIDTGASITAISTEFYQQLSRRYNAEFQGQFNINTAGGTVMASVYRFNVLSIAHLQVNNIAVVVLPFDNLPNAQGLLGMNFLREFEFKIDQRRGQLLIN